jgi:uncharacterized protein YndB with AHSA1/START domain
MSERSVEHATIVIERRYPASRERTFAAWADVEAKARWLGASEGALELDFRVGGRERHRGTLPDGRVYTYRAVYQDIVRPRRILYTYEMLLNDSRISISLATAESRRSTTAPASSSPSRAPSSTATRCPPAATRAWAACWTRWARSCRASKPPPERPTDSHVGATDPPDTAFTPQRATLLLGWAGRTAVHDRPPTWSPRTAVTDPPLSPFASAGFSLRSRRWSRPRPSHELEAVGAA